MRTHAQSFFISVPKSPIQFGLGGIKNTGPQISFLGSFNLFFFITACILARETLPDSVCSKDYFLHVISGGYIVYKVYTAHAEFWIIVKASYSVLNITVCIHMQHRSIFKIHPKTQGNQKNVVAKVI
jgi:hypothetical protein